MTFWRLSPTVSRDALRGGSQSLPMNDIHDPIDNITPRAQVHTRPACS